MSAASKPNRFQSVDDLPDLIPSPVHDRDPSGDDADDVAEAESISAAEPTEELLTAVTAPPAEATESDTAAAVAEATVEASQTLSGGLTAPSVPDLDGGTYRVSFDIPEDREAEISVALAGKRWSHGRKVGKAQLFRAALLVVLDNIDISELSFEHPHELEAEIAAALTEAARS